MITPPLVPDTGNLLSTYGDGSPVNELNQGSGGLNAGNQYFTSDMMHLFQSSMEKEFQKITSKLDGVLERIDGLEKLHNALEGQMRSYQCTQTSTSGSTPKTPSSRKRKRLTPVDLQVR